VPPYGKVTYLVSLVTRVAKVEHLGRWTRDYLVPGFGDPSAHANGKVVDSPRLLKSSRWTLPLGNTFLTLPLGNTLEGFLSRRSCTLLKVSCHAARVHS
jgi:hypothetical protein